MPQLIDQDPTAIQPDDLARKREKLALVLDEIGQEATAALEEAGLHMPIFFAVPNSGGALLSVVTPSDPSDDDWLSVCEIVCGIVGRITGTDNLRHRVIPCVAAGAPVIRPDLFLATGENSPDGRA